MNAEYEGVSFATVRNALHAIYFWKEGMPKEEFEKTRNFVVPMQHNFENPLQGGETDTFIEYWISRDDRETQDANQQVDDHGENFVSTKVADIDLRFVGRQAEVWAKMFHHMNKRLSVAHVFYELCQAQQMEYVGPIIPVNIDYYGVGNASIAFDLTVKLVYKESIDISWQRLGLISLAPGEIVGEGYQE